MRLRTDDVRYREAAVAGPVVLEVVPVTNAAFPGTTMEQFLCTSLFPHPLLVHGHVRYKKYRRQRVLS